MASGVVVVWKISHQTRYYQATYYQNRSHVPSPLCVHLYNKSRASLSGKVIGRTLQDIVDLSWISCIGFYGHQGLTSHIFFSSQSIPATWSLYVFKCTQGEYLAKGWCWEWCQCSKFLFFKHRRGWHNDCNWRSPMQMERGEKVGQLRSSFPWRGGDVFAVVKEHIMEDFLSAPSPKTVQSVTASALVLPGSDKLESFYI